MNRNGRCLFIQSAGGDCIQVLQMVLKTITDSIQFVRLFGIIAGFILLIACINFMNLSTARSEKRAKEVGIRKVVGAQKGSLIGQFIGESILMAFIAGIIAIVIVRSYATCF